MRSTSLFLAAWVALAVSVCVVSTAARAEDPPSTRPSESPQAPQFDFFNQQLRLPAAAEGNFETYAFLDVSRSLVAANSLGIDVVALEPALRAQLGLEEGKGLLVTAAPAECLGAKAGLKVHDVLIQLGDQPVPEVAKFKETLDAADGQKLKVRLVRGGKPVELEVTPKKVELARVQWSNVRGNDYLYFSNQLLATQRYRLGVQLSEIDAALRSQLRLANGEGLIVTEVVPGSAAEQAGVAAHDVLIMLDGKRLTTVEAINEQIQAIQDRETELRLLRGGKEIALKVAARRNDATVNGHADLTVRLWDGQTCVQCHKDPHHDAHRAMAHRIGAPYSVWTDGHKAHAFLHSAPRGKPVAALVLDGNHPNLRQQFDALKHKFDEFEQALAAFEAALAQPQSTDNVPKK